ncbi:MAG: TerB family tellurite resistance protein [Gammaproteobacteria bacterium]|nr:TerB family tellurite resistance protein [Gammaproteobacteria bacterium]
MIKKLQLFFEKNFMMSSVSAVVEEHQLNLAAAALLIEMVLQDDHVDKAEVAQVKKILVSQFDLSEAEMESLYALAEEEKHLATDYHQFTKLIAKHYTQPQKIRLIESLWRVAYADEVLDKYEEHMVRRISDLIHVSHKDFIQAKHRVENA